MIKIFSTNGYNQELLNCLAEAKQKCATLNQAAQIKAALAAGKFCVVEQVSYFCRSTDAFAGTYNVLAAIFDTRPEATAHASAAYEIGHYGDGDVGVTVLPLEPNDLADIGQARADAIVDCPF